MLSMMSVSIGMPISQKRHVHEALTRHNYFPNQKSVSEIPPCFSSRSFTPEVCEILSNSHEPQNRRSIGYDLVEYSSTRYNNIPRTLSLIHPKAYSLLVTSIYKKWEDIKHICDNQNSMIRPDRHLDGRMIIMNYEDTERKVLRSLEDGFGCNFRAHTDISGCFNSVYTHSIPWAVLGFEEAKTRMENRIKPQHWSEDIDMFQRKTKRNETQGIPIGPATSTIIVELILGKIDEKLREMKFTFRRYIDDYTCFCRTYEEAERFISELNSILSKYKMQLNLHKTSIVELPRPLNDGWVSELTAALPTKIVTENKERRKFTSEEITQFLDFAIKLNQQTADGAVMKFAVGLVLYSVEDYSAQALFNYVINLAWHFPTLLPFLDALLENHQLNVAGVEQKLNLIAIDNSEKNRSDGMAWSLYIMKKHEISIGEITVSAILKSKDCIGICTLLTLNEYNDRIVIFANEICQKTTYSKDQYWLLLYQLFLKNLIGNPYPEDKCFETLKKYDVNFIPENNDLTMAERYSDSIVNNPFSDPGIPDPTLDDWIKAERKK
nr:antiviral reverse transcriptase Drt4 [uncultured Janthinobacterium sp.]